MNRLVLWIALCLSLPGWLGTAAAQVPTVTRTVLLFTGMEKELNEALVGGDETAAAALLAEDFEERTAAAPGTPVPRADWLRAALKRGPRLESSQMAVRMLGETTAVVSFLASGPDGGRFLVDVWLQQEGKWKLAARYASPSPAQRHRRPTGKE